MSAPDPNEFARQVLWQLTLIRVELLEQTELVIAVAADKLGRDQKDLAEQFVRRVNTRAEVLYRRALRDAGMPEDPDRPPSSPDQGTNPRA